MSLFDISPTGHECFSYHIDNLKESLNGIMDATNHIAQELEKAAAVHGHLLEPKSTAYPAIETQIHAHAAIRGTIGAIQEELVRIKVAFDGMVYDSVTKDKSA